MMVANTQLSARVRKILGLREKLRGTQVEEVSGHWIANQVKLRA
jgi:hypothetical protein